MTVRANLFLYFLVFDRLRTPVTLEVDILSSLIVFKIMNERHVINVKLRENSDEQVLVFEVYFLASF